MPGGQVIQIGPFVGGLNTYSDASAVLDNELVQAENVELDLDGSLLSRPPIVDPGIAFPLGASGNISILGYYYADDGTPYLIASDGLSSTYYFTGSGWTLITNTIAATALAQYNSLAYLMSPLSSGNPGGSWSPTAGFVTISGIPHGSVLIAYKSRLWAAAGQDAGTGQNGTRIYLSNVGDPTTWAGSFISIGQGDGQNIVQLTTYYNDLMVFKKNSIYRFSYGTDPTTGVPSKLSPDIGLAAADCVVTDNSIVYFVYNDKVYSVTNYQINQINQKVPLKTGTTSGIYKPYSVSIFNRRLIISYYDTMFVYSLRTQKWTTWKSQAFGPIGRIVQLQTNQTNQIQAITHSSAPVATGGTRTAKTLSIIDAFIAGRSETMTCTIQTKNYNYESPGQFKRMFYWGIDAFFKGTMTGYANVVKLNSFPTWDQLLTMTWDQMLAFKWDSIGVMDASTVATIVNTGSTSSGRKFVKLGNGLRFRQIFFRLVFNTDGSPSTAPVRLFGIMTKVNTKETVVAQVT
jgi:hypothetical protein